MFSLCHSGTCSGEAPCQKNTISINFDWISSISLLFIYNGNRTEWSPILSVIIRVINKIGRPQTEFCYQLKGCVQQARK